MNRCPKCNQYYPDDLSFCLSDGTPLVGMMEDVEQQTFVRPGMTPNTEQQTVGRAPGSVATPVEPKAGNSVLKIAAVAAGLLILLFVIGGAVLAFILWPRETASGTNTANRNWNTKPSPNTSPIQSSNPVTNTLDPNIKDREDDLERERKKLADERRKLEDEKRRKEPDKDDAPTDPPTPPAFKDPGPTRIAFRRGSTGATVSGTVGRARSYMLRAMAGQYLGASVSSSGGCVVFSSGGTSTQFSVGSGDTYLYLKNTCSSPSNFTLSVTVR